MTPWVSVSQRHVRSCRRYVATGRDAIREGIRRIGAIRPVPPAVGDVQLIACRRKSPYSHHSGFASAGIPGDRPVRRTPCRRLVLLALTQNLCMYVIERLAVLWMQSGIIARHCSAESLCDICGQVEPVFRNILLFDTLVRLRTLLYVQLVRTIYRPDNT